VVALYGDLPTYRQLSDTSPNTTGTDVLQLETALVALGYDANGTVTVDDEFTFRTRQMVRRWQDDLGVEDDGVVQFGDVVFLPGPAQVVEQVVAPGDGAGGPILVVATGEPLTGSDVRQLEAALAGLDFDADGTLVVDGTYSPETTQAVFAFQAATGLPADGILSSGEIVFLPGEAQVTEQFAAEGSTVDPGSVILGVSLSEKVVQMELPADQRGLLAVSDAVIVELPDGTEVPATVSFVSQTATPSDFGEAFFEIQIGLDDPAVAGDLDEAPVDVIVVVDSVENVLAVPVSALVALLEGGYAVELDTGGGIVELVGVEVGFFGSNNMVEITSASLQPGDRVVVP
jgi:peptidoglycan hydrolase-like protein with peptidoglycan-binding domain